MNEPKRRGRPPKALWMGETQESASPDLSGVLVIPDQRPTTEEDVRKVELFRAQAYANKVWAGQSPSLPYGERWYRVKVALEAQGMSMDGVVLK